ncbi:unnamed protein product, partial [Prorocentrum cordatum]
MTALPSGALQQTRDVLLLSWLLELPIAGARVAGAAARCEARAVGAKFARLDGPVSADAVTQDDLIDLELEKLLIVVPAVCLPYDIGALASIGYVSVALRSALGEEMPADVACAKDEVIQFFDSAGGVAQPDLLALADLGPQPDVWIIGILLRRVAFPDPAPRGDPGRVGFQLS